MESSWVSNASMVLNQSKIGPLFEFKLRMPDSLVQWMKWSFGNTGRRVPCRVGKLYMPTCEWKSTGKGGSIKYNHVNKEVDDAYSDQELPRRLWHLSCGPHEQASAGPVQWPGQCP